MFGDQQATGSFWLRWEDISQDGRVRVEAIAVALSSLWSKLRIPPAIQKTFRQDGIAPLMTRFEIEGQPGPFPLGSVQIAGHMRFFHSKKPDGSVDRLLMDMRAEVHAAKGHTILPPPANAGELALVGVVIGEHTFTRPFAAPKERRVLSFDIDGASHIPPNSRVWKSPYETLAVDGNGVKPEDFIFDEMPIALGQTHTDSNQHVNSLVYSRLFEEAVLRRLHKLGHAKRSIVLCRTLDIAYRRPSFAGDILTVAVRLFEDGDRFEAVGAFFAQGENDFSKARVYVRMRFE